MNLRNNPKIGYDKVTKWLSKDLNVIMQHKDIYYSIQFILLRFKVE